MYNIDSHYENIFSVAKEIWPDGVKVVYFFPHGSTSVENIEYLNSGDRGPILLCYDQEPLIPGYSDAVFDYVQKQFVHYPENKILLLNTEQHSDAKQYFINKYNVKDVYYFFHIFAAHDWYRGYKYRYDIKKPSKRKIVKKFISFNRLTGNARSYRSIHVADLAQRNLLNFGHVSYSATCPLHENNIEQLNWAENNYNIEVNWAKSALRNISDLRIDSDLNTNIPNGSSSLNPIKETLESFLFVVTETEFWNRKCHLTEKIFKPILLAQPFVLLGPAHNLKYLQSYGFKTFSHWWDESYDQEEDPVKRICAVTNIIDSICRKSNDELQSMLTNMESTLLYNSMLFRSKEFLDNAWKELITNLRQHQ
jgi:hypothetical protein